MHGEIWPQENVEGGDETSVLCWRSPWLQGGLESQRVGAEVEQSV